MTKSKSIPPDPEGMNEPRALLGHQVIASFQSMTHADAEDALSDLLTDLMHWSDRNNIDFQEELERACRHYASETAHNPTIPEAESNQ